MALVVGAGASTGLGAAAVFFPSIVKLASRRVLAGSLGFSAGVMTYVSFIEIFQKSLGSFGDAGHEENKAYAYATLCFFSGVVVMMVSARRANSWLKTWPLTSPPRSFLMCWLACSLVKAGTNIATVLWMKEMGNRARVKVKTQLPTIY